MNATIFVDNEIFLSLNELLSSGGEGAALAAVACTAAMVMAVSRQKARYSIFLLDKAMKPRLEVVSSTYYSRSVLVCNQAENLLKILEKAVFYA